MGKKYTIEIENLETVAYLWAILGGTARGVLEDGGGRDFDRCFPGGLESARSQPVLHILSLENTDIYRQLNKFLNVAGITRTKAPWLKPTAPTKMGGNAVSCSPEGIKVGCLFVPLDEAELLVEKCKACGEEGT